MQFTASQLKLYRIGLRDVINEGVDGPEATATRLSARKITTKQAYEEYLMHGGLGLFETKGDGEDAAMDEVRTTFNPQYKPLVLELGVEYTQQTKQKDIYSFINSHGKMLADSAIMTDNKLASDQLQGGFSGGIATTPDGQPVFSSAHVLSTINSTASNVGTDDLEGLTLSSAIQNIMGQLGDRGLPVSRVPESWVLHVGPGLWGIANRAVNSEKLQGTFDNDDNEHVKKAIEKINVERFIGYNDATLASTWYMLPSRSDLNPLFCVEAQPVSTRVDQEVRSGNIIMVGSFERVWAWIGWRGTYANKP